MGAIADRIGATTLYARERQERRAAIVNDFAGDNARVDGPLDNAQRREVAARPVGSFAAHQLPGDNDVWRIGPGSDDPVIVERAIVAAEHDLQSCAPQSHCTTRREEDGRRRQSVRSAVPDTQIEKHRRGQSPGIGTLLPGCSKSRRDSVINCEFASIRIE